MQRCACRPNIGYSGARTLGGRVQPEKSESKTPEQELQAVLSLPMMKVQRVLVVLSVIWVESLLVAAG